VSAAILFIFYRQALFLSIYHIFANNISTFQPLLNTANTSEEHTYLPVPHLSNHIFWIRKYYNTNTENNIKIRSIFIFPLTLSPKIQDSERTNTEKTLHKLYKFYYTFLDPERKMLFFVWTFFTYAFLYLCFIFSCEMIYTHTPLTSNIPYLYSIASFTLFLLGTFSFFIYSYISLFPFPFIDNDIRAIVDDPNLSKQFRIYYYNGSSASQAHSPPSNLANGIEKIRTELMSTINAIIQIAAPILFLAIISITVALLNNVHNPKPEGTNVHINIYSTQKSSKR
jgi:hypothetical protein